MVNILTFLGGQEDLLLGVGMLELIGVECLDALLQLDVLLLLLDI